MKNKYIEEPRLIFRDTIQKNLIGPGSDILISDDENEIISDYPLSRYFSGIVFPEKIVDPVQDSFGFDNEINTNAETINNNNSTTNEIVENNDLGIEEDDNSEKKPKINTDNEYSEANQYFPTNFGLTFCVPNDQKEITVEFIYAKYKQLKPLEGKVEISQEDFEKFYSHPFNPIKQHLIFENGFVLFNKETFGKSGLNVRNYKKTFQEHEQQRELIDSVGYKKVELLLGRLWKRLPCEQKIIKINLEENNSNEATPIPLEIEEETKDTITCFFKKVLETNHGKFIKILLANRLQHSKKKFSFSNERLNSKAMFQAQIKVNETTFLPYKQFTENNPFDEELNIINFQYREEFSFAIGHGCAVKWNDDKNPTELNTTFLPEVDIKSYSNEFKDDFPEGLKSITELKKLSIWSDLSNKEIIDQLYLFVNEYQKWIDKQINIKTAESFKTIKNNIIGKQTETFERLIKNITFLQENEEAFKAFKLANTAMYIQMFVSNEKHFGKKNIELTEIDEEISYNNLDYFRENITFNPKYRPFQLAFFLLNIESLINPDSEDRNNIVDLLWFPTGGGKTEAYLALTAFTIISRRILNDDNAEGVAVIMRYTLRLLTAQQFERATKLILSLDFLRKQFNHKDEYYFGNAPISIGMWVGASSTPNSFKDAFDIYKKIKENLIKANTNKTHNLQKVNTFPIENCSWCGCKIISKNKFNFLEQGYYATPTSFTMKCVNISCTFSNELPIYFVDDKIYQIPPTLLFATVDKFAMISHREEGHKLFNSLDKHKLPPDLIIQDELHLLSGPLGSITGIYESIVELLSTKGNRKPKIIASTATTRNTAHQVEMLYGNRELNIFPPMGLSYNDNFFSFVSSDSKRKHIGIMPTGKTGLNSQIQILGNLFIARIELFKYLIENENLSHEECINKMNYFWTIVSFYNSLRDVGKIYNKVPAEILSLIKLLHSRYNISKDKYAFNWIGLPSRTKELTSRIESNSIK
ncbi:MAG: helicase, partial [Flavobacterium sp.]|nr:helicase [Flavobacterium sp.]